MFDSQKHRIAIFLPSLAGGGAERAMVILARGLIQRGFPVDLVLAQAQGPNLALVHPNIRLIDLKARRVLTSFVPLMRYLQNEKPEVLLSALEHASLVALAARPVAGVATRIGVCVQTTISQDVKMRRNRRESFVPPLVRGLYPKADYIIAVSTGAAEDLARVGNIPLSRVQVIFNPIVTPELLAAASQPVDHPYFAPNQPPVILGVGRLSRPKNFSSLIRAFHQVKQRFPSRLLILGEGEERPTLEQLVRSLDLDDCVSLPGFVTNPSSFMAKANVFVLSSLWEGLPTVLIEAGAIGTAVVSTNCRSGPAEILNHGQYGKLVPVEDDAALALGILETLKGDRFKPPASVWQPYTQDAIVRRYLEMLFPGYSE